MSTHLATVPYRVGDPPSGGSGYGDYLECLTKMIPGEAIGLYLVGNGMMEQGNAPKFAWWILFCAGFALTITVRIFGSKEPSAPPAPKPQWSVVIVSAVSYCIYIYALPSVNNAPFGKFRVAWVASLFVLSWTAFIPYFQRTVASVLRVR